MKCECVRENLTNALAAGEPELTGRLTLHIRSCTVCRSFYEAEAKLLLSIDAGLNSIVNHPVPTSLLPRVCKHLEAAIPQRNWLHLLVPATAALVLAVLLSVSLDRHKNVPANQTIASEHPQKPEQINAKQPSLDFSKPVAASVLQPHKPSARSSNLQRTLAAKRVLVPEVLVSPDELRGLRMLASTVYRQPAIGSAILNPLALPSSENKPIAAQEIAPLEVASLGIRPLAGEDH
jgi:hypothetical protein